MLKFGLGTKGGDGLAKCRGMAFSQWEQEEKGHKVVKRQTVFRKKKQVWCELKMTMTRWVVALS